MGKDKEFLREKLVKFLPNIHLFFPYKPFVKYEKILSYRGSIFHFCPTTNSIGKDKPLGFGYLGRIRISWENIQPWAECILASRTTVQTD